MRKLASQSFLLVSSFLATFATVYSVTANDDIWHGSTLRSVYPHGGGDEFWITFHYESDACYSQNLPYKYYKVKAGENGVTEDGVKNMLSVALAALVSTKRLVIAFEGGEEKPNCYISKMAIKAAGE